MLQKVENTGGEKVICLDCSKIVKKNVKKSCRGRMLSTQLTGNSVDVPGQPNHEISSENSLQTGWQSSCFCVRILLVMCDFCGFKILPNMKAERPLITNLSKAKAAKPGNK